MDEDAGLHIARGVDVAVDAAAGHAAAGELAVILEVDGVEFLAAGDAPDLPDAVFHIAPLLGIQQQVGGGAHAHGHVVEVPGEVAALADEHIQKLIAGDHLVVLGGVADGDAEGDAVLLHEVHGLHGLLEVALAPAAVVGVLKALHADGDEEVAHPQHLLAEVLVDEGAVGEGVEGHVPVLLAEADDVLLADQGLAAGEEAGVGAQLLGLGEDPVHLVIREALLVAVLRRPAAGAVHVAGGGGVHQDQPGDVAAVLLGVLLGLLIAPEAALVGRVGEEGLQDIGVALPQQALNIVGPLAVGILGDLAQGVEGLRRPDGAVDLLDHVHQGLEELAHILGLALFDDGVQHGLKGFALGGMGDLLGDVHSSQNSFLSGGFSPPPRTAASPAAMRCRFSIR